MPEKVYITPNLVTPNKPVTFDPEACIACNHCVDACPNDVLMPHPQQKQPPIIVFPEMVVVHHVPLGSASSETATRMRDESVESPVAGQSS